MSENQGTKEKKVTDKQTYSEDSEESLSIFGAKTSNAPTGLGIKPITEGLGFKDCVSSGVYTEELGETLPEEGSLAGAMDLGLDELGLNELGLDETGHGEVYIDDNGLRLQSSEVLRPVLFHSGHDGLIKKKAKKSFESFFAILIDLMLSLSGSILTLAFFMDFLGFSSIEGFLFDLKTASFNFIVIFLAFYLTYKILSRTFYGCSLGEWSCRLQMGSVKDQKKFIYIFQIAVREVVSLATGIFLLPLVSFIFSIDVGYYVSGLHVYIEKK